MQRPWQSVHCLSAFIVGVFTVVLCECSIDELDTRVLIGYESFSLEFCQNVLFLQYDEQCNFIFVMMFLVDRAAGAAEE